jgi:PAS domain S-box-containing protein
VVDPSDERWTAAIDERKRTGRFRCELRLRRRDGTIFPAEVTAQTYHDRHGQERVSLIIKDVTEKVESARLLRIQHRLARRLASPGSLKEGLDLCLAAAFEVSGMDAGGVYLVDRSAGTVDLAHWEHLSEEFVAKVGSYPIDSPPGRIVMEGKPLYQTRRSCPDSIRKDLEGEGLGSIAVIPILHEEAAIGCINLSSRHSVEISAVGREALEGICDQVGSAIARLRAEHALSQSEKRYRELVATIPYGVTNIDTTGVITFSNRAHHLMFGCEEGAMVGKDIFSFSPSREEGNALKRYLQSLIEAEPPPSPWSGRMVKEDGSLLTIQVDWDDRWGEGGEVTGFSAVISDVTERRKALEALQDSEEKFRVLAQESSNMIFIHDGGRVIYANPRCRDGLGYSREEIMSEDFDLRALVNPKDKDRLRSLEELPEMGEEVAAYEYGMVTRDGSTLEVMSSFRPITYRGQQVVLEICTDITERKSAEDALRESEERYRSLVERTGDVIFSLDREGKFIFLNPAFEKLTGFVPEEWLGRPFSEFIHPDDLPLLKERMVKVLEGEVLMENEVRSLSKSGEYDLVIEYSTVPLVTEGRVTSILGIARDISGRKRAEGDRRNIATLREREEISRWLHDHIGADLYNIILIVDSVQRKAPAGPVLDQQLEWISETSRKSLASIRNYLDFVSQVGSTLKDLVDHMEKYGGSLLSPLGTEFTFVLEGDLSRPVISGLKAFSFYLIFKESLTNIIKHASPLKMTERALPPRAWLRVTTARPTSEPGPRRWVPN